MKTPKVNLLTKLLCKCSGANWRILKELDTEYTKYALVGATLLITAILASISGGYFIYWVFKNTYIALGFGFFWGLVIYSLDLYIVTSIHKSGNKLSWNNFLMALPRLILAILLALVISKPLELKFFEREINTQLQTTNDSLLVEFGNVSKEIKIINDKLSDLDNIEQNLESQFRLLKSEEKALEKEVAEKHQIYLDEVLGNEGRNSSGNTGDGPLAKQRKEEWVIEENLMSAKRKEINDFQDSRKSQVSNAQKERDNLKKEIRQLAQNREASLAESDGPLNKLKALNKLISTDNSLKWANRLIVLIFILIETAPVTVKLLSRRSAYDLLIEEEESRMVNTKKKKLQNQGLKETLELERETGQITIDSKFEASKWNMKKESDVKMWNKVNRNEDKIDHQVADSGAEQDADDINNNDDLLRKRYQSLKTKHGVKTS